MDNTNSNIIYYTLKNLEIKNDVKYKQLCQKYKFFLNEENEKKLNILYLDNKKNVLEIFESIQKMNPSNPYLN